MSRAYLYKLPENPVRRNYRGGAALDLFRRKTVCTDGDQPEDWLLSTVEARNPGLPPLPGEGLTRLPLPGEGLIPLPTLIESDPDFWVGKKHCQEYGAQTGFLTKLLDSAMRLHVQAHPNRAFAQAHLNSRYGKMECYYILGVRPGYTPYIRLGFQQPVTREEWGRIVREQDIEAMDACFQPIPVAPGQVWHIPGGMPHAIGEGLLMIEIMEPTDLVVRCEFVREGVEVPPQARFMGRDLEFALDIFDYTAQSVQSIEQSCRIRPRLVQQTDGHTLERLIDETVTDCFEVNLLKAEGKTELALDGRFHLGTVCVGAAVLDCDGSRVRVSAGDSYVCCAAAKSLRLEPIGGKVEICMVLPGETP